MPKSPHTPEVVAEARATLTDTQLMALVTSDQRRELVEAAQAIIRRDIDWRKRTAAAEAGDKGALVVIPLSLWQAGRGQRRILRVVGTRPTTPGDAA
jgi:hypothetical protein